MTSVHETRLLTELRVPMLRSSRAEHIRDFYNGVLGAETTVIAADSRNLGAATWGLIVPDADAPAKWLPRAVSDDLESVKQRVRELGGDYSHEASLGENLLITAPDRSQIVITERKPGDERIARELRMMLELCTREIESSCAFYTRVLDLEQVAVPDDPYSYRVLFANETGLAGVVDMTSFFRETTESHWIPYFQVDDIHRAVETSVAYGARVTVPIDESLFETRYATLIDPTGATFGLREQPRRGSGVFGAFSPEHGRFLTDEELAGAATPVEP
ncbi:MAG: VOC family protein [Leucobacter sp.]|nr:VOC family protein [Leucobacter sp.]